MDNLRNPFIFMCLFTSVFAGAQGSECRDERALARLSDSQIIAAARRSGIGKCKLSILSNGTTSWIQVSGVYEFKGPVGKTLVQEEYPTNDSEAHDLALQKLMIRFREKLVDCECVAD